MVVSTLLVASMLVAVATATADPRGLRRQGDDFMLLRQWSQAVEVLSRAITLDPTSYLGYLKRSQAHAGAGSLKLAVADLNEVLARQPGHEKSHVRRVELLLALGDYAQALSAARTSLSTATAGNAAELGSLQHKAALLHAIRANLDAAKQQQNWQHALAQLEHLIASGADRDRLATERCEILFSAGQYYEVVADAMAILKRDPSNCDVLLLRSRAFFHLGELAGAINHLKQCIKVDPDHVGCAADMKLLRAVSSAREKAQQLMADNQWGQAVPALKEALALVPDIRVYQAEITVQLCESISKGGTTIEQWKEGVELCGRAAELSASPDAMKELRGELHVKLGKYVEAIQDFSAVLQSQPNNFNLRQRIQQVQNAKKLAERKDYYKILDVSRDCSKRDAKASFRRLAMKWHPDRFTDPAEHEKANVMFADINEAYAVIKDPEKRARYDRGEDVDEQPQNHGFHQGGFNPFGGGGGQQFHFKFG